MIYIIIALGLIIAMGWLLRYVCPKCPKCGSHESKLYRQNETHLTDEFVCGDCRHHFSRSDLYYKKEKS